MRQIILAEDLARGVAVGADVLDPVACLAEGVHLYGGDLNLERVGGQDGFPGFYFDSGNEVFPLFERGEAVGDPVDRLIPFVRGVYLRAADHFHTVALETELRKIDQRILRCADFEPQVDLFADADARGVGAPGQGRRGRLARGSPRECQDEQDGENLAQQIIACGNNRVIFLHSHLWCLC